MCYVSCKTLNTEWNLDMPVIEYCLNSVFLKEIISKLSLPVDINMNTTTDWIFYISYTLS